MATAAVLSSCSNSADNPAAVTNGELEQRVSKLEAAEDWRDVMEAAAGTAYLNPSEKSYSMARADFGSVAVVLDDVQPYANGTKIGLRLGNPTTATVAGLNAKLVWGRTDEKGNRVGVTQNKVEKLAENLMPASWHTYTVILPNTRPAQIGYIDVSEIKSESITLSNR